MSIKIPEQRLSDTTYDKICESLFSGKIRPGDWLRQAVIAEELKVSQVTVRDALNKMVMEGLAERVPRKGVRIPYVSGEDLVDIYEMRIVAEGLAWEAAAKNINEEELSAMREILPLTGANADPKSVSVTRKMNKEFHMIAIQASRRWTLISVLSSLLNMNNLFFLLTSTTEQDRIEDGKRNIADHVKLIEALEQSDAPLARELIQQHIHMAMSDRIALQNREEFYQ